MLLKEFWKKFLLLPFVLVLQFFLFTMMKFLSADVVFISALKLFVLIYIFIIFSFLFQKFKTISLEKRYSLYKNKYLIYLKLYSIVLLSLIFYIFVYFIFFFFLNNLNYINDFNFIGEYQPVYWTKINWLDFSILLILYMLEIIVFVDFLNRFITNKAFIYGILVIIVLYMYFLTSFYLVYDIFDDPQIEGTPYYGTSFESNLIIAFEVILPFQIYSNLLSVLCWPSFNEYGMEIWDFSHFILKYPAWLPFVELSFYFIVTNILRTDSI